mgnify:CR=1 FL=1
MKLYSSGEVADLLGVHRDKILWAIKCDAPRPSLRLGKRNAFTHEDVTGLHAWFIGRGIEVTAPNLDTTDACHTSPA